MTTNQIKCTVCQRPRHSLKARKSRLKPDMQMWLCGECIEARREPRFLVVLIARNDRSRLSPDVKEALRDCIVKHKYYGEKITAEEITP